MSEPWTIVSFESRRAQEMARLIERQGAHALVAPSLREEPILDASLAAFRDALDRDEVDALILLTGVGTRALVTALAGEGDKQAVVERLSKLTIGARGPKVFAALKELRVSGYLAAQEPYEWTNLVAEIERAWSLRGLRVWIQEYGTPHPDLVAWLSSRGAVVNSVKVYQWLEPEDLGPMRAAVDALVARSAQAVLFTSAPQVERVLDLAREAGREDALRDALAHTCVGSIGPTCSARLRKLGLHIDVEPEHSHMGHLVKAVVERLKGTAATP